VKISVLERQARLIDEIREGSKTEKYGEKT
jgi:hypothetical protein